MADIDININSKAQLSGIESARKGLDKMNKDASMAAAGITGVGNAVSSINPAIGGLIASVGTATGGVKGLLAALRAFVTTPFGLAITAIGAAFAAWRFNVKQAEEAQKRLNEELNRTAARNVDKATRNAANAYRDAARAARELASETKHLHEIETMRVKGQRTVEDAQKQKSLAEALMLAPDKNSRDKVKAQFDADKINTTEKRALEDIERRANDAFNSNEHRAKLAETDAQIKGQKDIIDALTAQFRANTADMGKDVGLWGGMSVDEQNRLLAKQDEIMAQMAAAYDKLHELEKDRKQLAETVEPRSREIQRSILAERDGVRETANAQRTVLLEGLTTPLKDQLDALYKEQAEEGPAKERAIDAGGNFSTAGGFATEGAKLAAQFSETYTVENKAATARQKQIELLEAQLEETKKLVQSNDEAKAATFS